MRSGRGKRKIRSWRAAGPKTSPSEGKSSVHCYKAVNKAAAAAIIGRDGTVKDEESFLLIRDIQCKEVVVEVTDVLGVLIMGHNMDHQSPLLPWLWWWWSDRSFLMFRENMNSRIFSFIRIIVTSLLFII